MQGISVLQCSNNAPTWKSNLQIQLAKQKQAAATRRVARHCCQHDDSTPTPLPGGGRSNALLQQPGSTRTVAPPQVGQTLQQRCVIMAGSCKARCLRQTKDEAGRTLGERAAAGRQVAGNQAAGLLPHPPLTQHQRCPLMMAGKAGVLTTQLPLGFDRWPPHAPLPPHHSPPTRADASCGARARPHHPALPPGHAAPPSQPLYVFPCTHLPACLRA